MESKADKWPEICLPNAESIGEFVFDYLTICSSTFLRIEQHLIPTKFFLDQVFPFNTYFRFFFSLFLVPIGRFFHWKYPGSFDFPLIFSHRVLGFFHWLIPLFAFLLQSLLLGWEVFHQWHNLLRFISLSMELRYFSISFLVFLLSPPHWLKDFLSGSYSKFLLNRQLYAQWSSCLRKMAIVITWSQNLSIIWPWYKINHITFV